MEVDRHMMPRVLSFSKRSNSSSLRAYGKLDPVKPNPEYESSYAESNNNTNNMKKSRARCFFAAICGVFVVSVLTALCILLAVRARHNNNNNASDPSTRGGSDGVDDLSSGTAAIQAACNATLYPELCFDWLSSQPGALTANPLQLATIALGLAGSFINESVSILLSTAADSLNNSSSTPLSQSIRDCIELMEFSQDQLNSSALDLKSLSLLSLKSELFDIKAQLSGTMGFQLACSEGLLDVFDNQTFSASNNASIPDDVRALLVDSQEKVSKGIIIVLGIVNALSNLGNDVSSWKDLVSQKLHFRRRRLLNSDSLTSISSQSHGHIRLDSHQFSSIPSQDQHNMMNVNNDQHNLMNVNNDQHSMMNVNNDQHNMMNVNNADGFFPDWLSESDRRMLQSTTSVANANIVVAQDGSGKYKTIKEALANVPSKRTTTFTIYIKKGVYSEYVTIPKSMKNLTLLGDGIGLTIITGSKSFTGGSTTYNSATVAISSPYFIARGITFRNTAGPSGHQAVALRVNSDYAVFDSCGFDGYQDTLYALANRQFYTGCTIRGTVDFIFGNAIAVFQRCNVLGRLPMSNQKNTFTAQGRKVSDDVSGFSFHLCTVAADKDLLASSSSVKSYFGRPWKAYSRTVWMQCSISSAIDPAGWLPWDATNPYTNTLYYGEYQNTGDGAKTGGRVAWKGVRTAMSRVEANGFTVQNFISGSGWLPNTKVSFQASLS